MIYIRDVSSLLRFFSLFLRKHRGGGRTKRANRGPEVSFVPTAEERGERKGEREEEGRGEGARA